jgi:hypothetical protein
MTQKLQRAKQKEKTVFAPFIGVIALLIPFGNFLTPAEMAISIFVIFVMPSLIILRTPDRNYFGGISIILLAFVYFTDIILSFEKSQVLSGLVFGILFMLAAVFKSRRY